MVWCEQASNFLVTEREALLRVAPLQMDLSSYRLLSQLQDFKVDMLGSALSASLAQVVSAAAAAAVVAAAVAAAAAMTEM